MGRLLSSLVGVGFCCAGHGAPAELSRPWAWLLVSEPTTFYEQSYVAKGAFGVPRQHAHSHQH